MQQEIAENVRDWFLINIIPRYSLKNKERDGEAPSWLQLTKSKTFKTHT